MPTMTKANGSSEAPTVGVAPPEAEGTLALLGTGLSPAVAVGGGALPVGKGTGPPLGAAVGPGTPPPVPPYRSLAVTRIADSLGS